MKRMVFDCRGAGSVFALPGAFDKATGAYLCEVKKHGEDGYFVLIDGRVFGRARLDEETGQIIVD